MILHISYQSVIEVTKSNSDFLWNASAMEGLYCAVVLLAFIQADISVSATIEAYLTTQVCTFMRNWRH